MNYEVELKQIYEKGDLKYVIQKYEDLTDQGNIQALSIQERLKGIFYYILLLIFLILCKIKLKDSNSIFT